MVWCITKEDLEKDETRNQLYRRYHDEEWGRPLFDSVLLFEMLCLSGQQAGLTWFQILKRRENYRKAFHQFDPYAIANMTADDVQELLLNKEILRNKAKINSIINNAKRFIEIEREGLSFCDFIWSFVENTPIVNSWKDKSEIPTESLVSVALAKALKKRKFTFVGSIICYAYMQSVGMIDDHLNLCHAKTSKEED